MLVSSQDKSATMWQISGKKRGEHVLTMNQNFTNIESIITPKKDIGQPFSKEVRKAQFYYQDALLCAATGNSLSFYSYEMVDPNLKDDVKRLQTKVRYKEVQKFSLKDAQTVITFDAHNRVKSQYALLAGSNKSLYLYDVNSDQNVFIIPEAHSRAIHTIKFVQGSDFIGCSESQFNIFGTSSLDSTIKLWDIRQSKPVRAYMEHSARMMPIGFEFSTCLRYVITGSEDRCFVVYDMRMDRTIVFFVRKNI